jgi:hypothetical protein
VIEIPGFSKIEWLSWGSQADVYRGTDANGVVRALKIVRADRVADDPDAMTRLGREAKLLATIDSPFVVRVHGYLVHPRGDWHCVVLDYLPGEPLHKHVTRRCGITPEPDATRDSPTNPVTTPEPNGANGAAAPPRRSPDEPTPPALCTEEHVAWALDRAIDLTRGVVAMHGVGVHHRDLKPHNVMLVDDRAILIDFGFARTADLTAMTRTGAMVGTFAYMSPQQLRGIPATEVDDIYGLGSTIFHLLTGRPPGAESIDLLSQEVARRRPPNVGARNAAAGRSLPVVLAKCLEPDRRDRYQSAAALLADLERCRDGKRIARDWSPRRFLRHQQNRLLAGGAVLGLLVLCAWLLTLSSPEGLAHDLLAAAARDPVAARSRWLGLPHPERQSVLLALNRLVSADRERAEDAAQALDLGTVAFDARADCRIAVFEANQPPPSTSISDFVTGECERHLIVPKGNAWLIVTSRDPLHWWAKDDPFCLQLLVAVRGASDRTRSLQRLHLVPFARHGSLVPFVPDDASRELAADGRIPSDLHVAAYEVSGEDVHGTRSWLRTRIRDATVDLDLLAHPEEPEAAREELRRRCEEREPLARDLPAMLTFWEAWCFAAVRGCRLPMTSEWLTFATQGVPDVFLSSAPRPVDLVPVRADSKGDRTRSELHFANSNAPEWLFDRGAQAEPTFAVGPALMTENRALPSSREMFAGAKWMSTFRAHRAASQLHGLRLVRTRFRP